MSEPFTASRVLPLPPTSIGGISPEDAAWVRRELYRRRRLQDATNELRSQQDPLGFSREMEGLMGFQRSGTDPFGQPLTPETRSLLQQMFRDNGVARANAFRNQLGPMQSAAAAAMAPASRGLPSDPVTLEEPNGGNPYLYSPEAVAMSRAGGTSQAERDMPRTNMAIGYPLHRVSVGRYAAANRQRPWAPPSIDTTVSAEEGAVPGWLSPTEREQFLSDAGWNQTLEDYQASIPSADLAAAEAQQPIGVDKLLAERRAMQQPPAAAPNPGREAALRFLQSRTPQPDPLDVIMARGLEGNVTATTPALNPPLGNAAKGPRFMVTDSATGDLIPNRKLLQSMTPEQRAGWIRALGTGEKPTEWRTSGQADPNPRIDAMIADTEAKTRARLLAENPSLRGTPFETGGDPRDILARQMMLTPRERAMEAILNAPGDRAAQLRADPALADRIAMERQLTARMTPDTPAVDPNVRMARADELLRDFRGRNDAAAARLAAQPAYRDEARIAEVAAQRQAERAQRQQMVSAIARGRQGIFTKEDAMNLMLMRTPGAAEAMLRGQQGMQDNLTRLLLGKMQTDAELARGNNYQQFTGKENELNRQRDREIAQMNLQARGIDEARRLLPEIADVETKLEMLSPGDPRRAPLEARLRALKSMPYVSPTKIPPESPSAAPQPSSAGGGSAPGMAQSDYARAWEIAKDQSMSLKDKVKALSLVEGLTTDENRLKELRKLLERHSPSEFDSIASANAPASWWNPLRVFGKDYYEEGGTGGLQQEAANAGMGFVAAAPLGGTAGVAAPYAMQQSLRGIGNVMEGLGWKGWFETEEEANRRRREGMLADLLKPRLPAQ